MGYFWPILVNHFGRPKWSKMAPKLFKMVQNAISTTPMCDTSNNIRNSWRIRWCGQKYFFHFLGVQNGPKMAPNGVKCHFGYQKCDTSNNIRNSWRIRLCGQKSFFSIFWGPKWPEKVPKWRKRPFWLSKVWHIKQY